jgi:hypothetical protein
MLGGMVLVLSFGVNADAPAVRYTARVKADGAEVRCGPSSNPEMYPTNKLRRDETIEVLDERPDGWLAIKPPQGSFSWVNGRWLRKGDGPDAWVVDVEAPVLIGSALKDDRPTVEGREKVPRGQLLVAVGKPRTDSDGLWLPVMPPPREVRYIRAEAVEKIQTPAPTPAPVPAASPTATPVQVSAPVLAPLQNSLPPSNPDWQRAQQAEQAGKTAEAIQLYTELGKKVANTDPVLSNQAYNRAVRLRQSLAGRPSEVRYPNPAAEAKLTPLPTGQGTSQPPGSGQARVPGAPQQWRGQGRLYATNGCIDHRRAYLLQTPDGRPLTYVAAQPGLDLEPFVGRNVEVSGVITYRQDIRAYYTTATQVTRLP